MDPQIRLSAEASPVWISNSQPKEKAVEASLKFCLYARKSSESDERQAMSIDSQIKEMLEYAKRENISVAEIKQESHSAKDSAQRPVFNQLLLEIRAGKYNGVITWAADRLSRNAGDLGSLVDLMDAGLLQEIRTYNQRFSNSPNEKFLLMILCSQAKLENDNKVINVERGMKAKCEMGYRPVMAPLGFLNNRLKQTIRVDRKRAPLVKEMFEKVAYYGYTGREVQKWLNSEGFRTRTGKCVTYSTVFCMLKNPYYYGHFEFPVGSGKWYKTKHKPIITKKLFDEVQKRSAMINRTLPGNKVYDFTRILKCGNCGSGISASTKIKRFKKGTRHEYTYYFCTKFKDPKCNERYTREEILIRQLEHLIDRIPAEQIEADEEIQTEITRFISFGESVLNYCKTTGKPIAKNADQIDVKMFAKYIIRYGSREEKRALLGCIKTTIFLKDRKIYVE